MQGGAMDDEKDRSGRIPDEFMKVAVKASTPVK